MVNVQMVLGEGAEERDCGTQAFAFLPRAEDFVIGYLDGRMAKFRVRELYHYPISSAGPERTPFAVIGVSHC